MPTVEHVVGLRTEELEVIQRALMQRWQWLERVARDANLEVDVLERHAEWCIARDLAVRLSVLLHDARQP
jgi:hypothetical protein